ncbi:MAG: metallophosphoesterase [Clostridia bacterium]|nr:metallophosphoesterase [Clostridia bacterium]
MKHFRKVLAVLLSVLMVFSACVVSLTVTAAQNETIIIAGSDYQTHDGTAHIELILDAMAADGIQPDKLLFGGDYSLEHSAATSQKGITQLKNYFSAYLDEKDMVFTQGNHDKDATEANGLTGWGNLDPAYGEYGLYAVEDPTLAQEWGSYDAASVAALQLYLQNKIDIGFSKPIFIMNHFPLHWSYRTQKDGVGTNAYRFFNVINNAAAQGLNIIYLFGHNHSNGYDDSLGGPCIFLKKGDTIEIAQGDKKTAKAETLNFTYMNSGYTGYYTSPMANAETTLSMSVFRIRGNEVYITRYSKDGAYNLKSAGTENTSFGYTVNPTVNTTVYAGSWKIAADGTATAVDTIFEKADDNNLISNGETSTSEDVKGLAFKFDVTASDVAYTMEKNSYVVDYTNATINGYKLVGMGAIVTNKTAIGTDGSSFYKGAVDGKRVIDISCKYLWGLGDASASFAVRITNIPDTAKSTAVYARPYYIYENENGTEITVYGDVVGASYNGKLSNNDGELEW